MDVDAARIRKAHRRNCRAMCFFLHKSMFAIHEDLWLSVKGRRRRCEARCDKTCQKMNNMKLNHNAFQNNKAEAQKPKCSPLQNMQNWKSKKTNRQKNHIERTFQTSSKYLCCGSMYFCKKNIIRKFFAPYAKCEREKTK